MYDPVRDVGGAQIVWAEQALHHAANTAAQGSRHARREAHHEALIRDGPRHLARGGEVRGAIRVYQLWPFPFGTSADEGRRRAIPEEGIGGKYLWIERRREMQAGKLARPQQPRGLRLGAHRRERLAQADQRAVTPHVADDDAAHVAW